jgi:hypothetical protein
LRHKRGTGALIKRRKKRTFLISSEKKRKVELKRGRS